MITADRNTSGGFQIRRDYLQSLQDDPGHFSTRVSRNVQRAGARSLHDRRPVDARESTPDTDRATRVPDDEYPPPPSADVAAGRYELLDEIAHGGMGVILRAKDRKLGREVAVKVLQDRYALGSLVCAGSSTKPGSPASSSTRVFLPCTTWAASRMAARSWP